MQARVGEMFFRSQTVTVHDKGSLIAADSLTLAAIERHGQFSYRRFTDPADARRRVRQGELAFVLEVPAVRPVAARAVG